MRLSAHIAPLALAAVSAACVAGRGAAAVPEAAARQPAPPANAARLEWWRAARFGMFIHWGPVSLKGTEIGWSRGAEVPIEEYDALHKQFNPVRFDADQWAETARGAGMKYVVLTTKHHDGFCLWDTKETDFDIMGSPFHRDVVRELAEACRRKGLEFGTYYSVCDWHHPAFPFGSPGGTTQKPNPDIEVYTEYLRNQVAELVRGYGPLLVLWFDVAQGFDAARGQSVVDYVRSLQPDILINNRCANPGDYDTPEQTVGKFQRGRPWESCITLCQQWAWKPDDRMKSLAECVQTLVRCAGGDGNLLLNVGPMPTGEIEPRQADRLREIGAWLEAHGESVYGTRGGPFMPGRWGASTCRGNRVYVHVLDWGQAGGGVLALPPLPARVVSSTRLGGGAAAVRQTPERVEIAVPESDRDRVDTVVVLELDRPAFELEPVRWPSRSLARGRPATASNTFQKMEQYAPGKAFDDDDETRWATDWGTHQAWLEVDLGEEKTLGEIAIREECGSRIRRFELQARTGDGWTTFAQGTTVGESFRMKFTPVKARVVRLSILEATEGPTLSEVELLPPTAE